MLEFGGIENDSKLFVYESPCDCPSWLLLVKCFSLPVSQYVTPAGEG
jgi:hypothetical protein